MFMQDLRLQWIRVDFFGLTLTFFGADGMLRKVLIIER